MGILAYKTKPLPENIAFIFLVLHNPPLKEQFKYDDLANLSEKICFLRKKKEICE